MPSQQWKQFNCYKVLGLPPTATIQEIKAAYRQASLRSHPDRPGGSHEAQLRVNLAYAVLSNPIERQAHDLYWLSTVARTSSSSSNRYSSPRKSTSSQQAYAKSKQEGSKRTNSYKTGSYQRGRSHYQYKKKTYHPLDGLKARINEEIEKERKRIWDKLEKYAAVNEQTIFAELRDKRNELIYIFVGAVIAGLFATKYPILWFVVMFLGWSFVNGFDGIRIRGETFSVFASREKVKKHAKKVANDKCRKEEQALQRHFSTLAQISNLLLRSSTFDDSEEQIAKRLTTAFFLMGYIPLSYDRKYRTILFTDSEEKILVRFRHRSGVATNIAYVRKMYEIMLSHSVRRGYLFCSPGLSGNAAEFAQTGRIQWYSLETMNNWIENVISSNYRGPSGDLLSNLDKLKYFITGISPRISGSRKRSAYKRRW